MQTTTTDPTFNYGRLEVYINGQWGTVCSHSFDQNDADVACQQLGYENAYYYLASNTAGYYLILIYF